MNDIFVTRRIPQAGLDLLQSSGVPFRVGETQDQHTLSRDRLLEEAGQAKVILSLVTDQLDRAVLEAGPGLRGVAQFAVGYDNIDISAATALGIPVSNTPGVLTEATADFAWALLMAVARQVPQAHAYTVGGHFRTWGPNLFLGTDVGPGPDGRRKVLGILGFGRIGAAVARRAAGFDMVVLAHTPGSRERIEASPGVAWAEFSELLERSDFLSLNVPLRPETHHIMDAEAFRRMKPSAFLVNTARGPVVDEAALVHALESGQIAGAALDVYEKEPEIHQGLLALPNVVLAPHIGSGSRDTRQRMAKLAAQGAIHHFRGEAAPHTVNPTVYQAGSWRARVQDGG
ncbi:MAG: D-glycerate dehydrogenase [Gemmatimonadota bacterium]